MPILPDLCDSEGWLRIGAIATLVDSAAGSFSVREVTPDWVATLALGTVLHRRAEGEIVTATCRPIRIGRNNVTTETMIWDDDVDGTTGTKRASAVASAICTYARLPGREDNPSTSGRDRAVIDYAEADEEARVPIDDYLRLVREPEAPIITLDHHSRIHNSFGSIQGGAVVMMVEAAAVHAAELVWGRPARCVDTQVTYLAQSKGGPFRVSAEMVRDDGAASSVRVEIVDVGHSDRLLDVATATIVPA